MNRLEIKKMLPSGYRDVLSMKSGYSKGYIDMWFAAKVDNLKIEYAAMEYLAEVIEERKLLENRLKAALK